METAMYLGKLLLTFYGIWLIYKSSSKNAKSWNLSVGLLFFGFVLFMTGIEFMSPTEQVWSYLFEETSDDYEKALIDGLLMLSLPFILYAFCGNDIAT